MGRGRGPRAHRPAGSRRRVFLLRWVQIALKPASKAPGLHGVFMRDKGLKFVIADSAFKRKQVDARACSLDTGEHHPGLALRTSGARNCSEWNGARKALRLGHDAFPRIGGSATLSHRESLGRRSGDCLSIRPSRDSKAKPPSTVLLP